VHRKEYELKQVKSQRVSTTDPVRMAMGYAQESPPTQMRLAAALRRVHDDPSNPANINNLEKESATKDDPRTAQMAELGLVEMSLRRGSFIADIKRKSLSRPGETFCSFDDAGKVAQAMVRLGADAVFINTDFAAYGGDLSELKSAVTMVRQVSKTAAVVMKDIVVDEIQLGLAKESGADGILLISSVLGPSLETFLNLATTIGLETIVECHTKAEVERALYILAPNILVNNFDRIGQIYYPQQAIQLAGLFPGSGGPIICLATGNIDTAESMKRHLAVGYDGIVIGKAIMGSAMAPELIRACRDRTLLPAELSQWGLMSDDDTIGAAEFDMNGNIMSGPKRDVPSPNDPNTYQ
jgi:indole-3-glycerol phosphate synthase